MLEIGVCGKATTGVASRRPEGYVPASMTERTLHRSSAAANEPSDMIVCTCVVLLCADGLAHPRLFLRRLLVVPLGELRQDTSQQFLWCHICCCVLFARGILLLLVGAATRASADFAGAQFADKLAVFSVDMTGRTTHGVWGARVAGSRVLIEHVCCTKESHPGGVTRCPCRPPPPAELSRCSSRRPRPPVEAARSLSASGRTRSG